ncbi:5'-3' exonuclease H3TH domain-containing protein [Lysobacter sp. N42]|uniref:5'-3' exonuclease n=1 Tax=Lysobacter sp. N42 TaxID=2545719 RepID=UPI00104CC75A|nr:5'-3' exonuclease H3TH domain-containing protein [Lysobacter sp. N42]TCZ83407.1 exodeoxyribonuclease IX [Lysobacter sp. N42]
MTFEATPAAATSPATGAAPTLHLVDASVYVFRAWHSMPNEFVDADGWPTNAVHGFARFLLELLERTRPDHVVVAFDEALDTCFRNRLYPAYKANREPAPEELKRQFAHCRALCEAMGLTTLAHTDFEADDLIGSALHMARAHGFRGVIVSADKDLSQLLGEHDEQWDFARGQRWSAAGVPARHGVRADQIADYLALTGDAIDNIPGVPGIGAKTAAALLAHFGSLDALLARIDEVPYLSSIRGAARCAQQLRTHREQARLCRELATIALHAPCEPAVAPFRRGNACPHALRDVADRLRFGPLTRRRLHAACGVDFMPRATEAV